ncbi:MAG TPA: hypothetical protein VII06_13960 [Chloroflexota bacterium]|jgi:tRNA(fMet)-specific endonuclease VapC
MKYLVDTDLVIDYLKNVPSATQLLNSLLAQGIAISILTYAEIWEGILGATNPKQREADFRLFLRSVTVLGVSRPVARRPCVLTCEPASAQCSSAHSTSCSPLQPWSTALPW